jgi:hypothetical protein
MEVVNKYPSKIVSSKKNEFGDNLIEIAIESSDDKHKTFYPWKINVCLNTSKGYNIDRYEIFFETKTKPSVKLMTECAVKKYQEIKDGIWVASHIEIVNHNGNLNEGIRTNYVFKKINVDPLEPWLNDFQFPENMVVREQSINGHKIHIWGKANKPVHSFDRVENFLEYYTKECQMNEQIPEKNYYFFRILFIVLGLFLIVIGLYAKWRKQRN